MLVSNKDDCSSYPFEYDSAGETYFEGEVKKRGEDVFSVIGSDGYLKFKYKSQLKYDDSVIGHRNANLYTIHLEHVKSSSPICLIYDSVYNKHRCGIGGFLILISGILIKSSRKNWFMAYLH